MICFFIMLGSIIHIATLCIVDGKIEQLLWLPRDIYYHSNLNWLGVVLLYILYWIFLPFFAAVPILKLIFTRR